MNYVIFENDRMSLAYMKKMCAELRPSWILAFTAGDAAGAAAWLDEHADEVDLIITDVELDDGSCFDIFDKVRLATPVIFTTAFDEYVMRTFEQNNIDYLLKPVEPQALERAFDKFEELQQHAKLQLADTMLKVRGQLEQGSHYVDRILISLGDRFWYVNISEVAFFVSEDKYVYATLFNGSRHIISFKSLNDLEAELDPHQFFRVSRDAIASIRSIRRVSRFFKGRLSTEIGAQDKTMTVTISAERRNAFLNWLGK